MPKTSKPWYVRHRIFATLLALLTAAGVIGITYRPVMAQWNHHQALKLATQASAAMKKLNWSEASLMLMKAYVAAPYEPMVLRECAYYERVGADNPVLSGFYLKQLIKLGIATGEERSYMGQSLVAESKMKEAKEILATVPNPERESIACLNLQSMIAAKEGDVRTAEALLRRALAIDSENPESALKLALMDLQNPAPEIQEHALAALWNIARSPTGESVAAIEKLTSFRTLTPAQSAELVQLAGAKRTDSETLYFYALSACIKLHSLDREGMIEKEIAGVPPNDEKRLAQLCQWLVYEAEYDRVLKLISRTEAAQKAALFPVYVEALVRKQNWAELEDFLVNEKTLPTTYIDVIQLRARCADGMGRPRAAVTDFLKTASQLAAKGKDFYALEHLAELAENLGYPDIAINCLQGTLGAAPSRWKANLEHMMKIESNQNDMPAMLKLLSEINLIDPQSYGHFEDLIYLKLIGGIELETVMDECTSYAANGKIRPESLIFFKALDAYRNSDLTGLKVMLEKLDFKRLPLNWRAVFAGMLSSTGDQNGAFQIAEKIPANTLLQEEKKIFQPAL